MPDRNCSDSNAIWPAPCEPRPVDPVPRNTPQSDAGMLQLASNTTAHSLPSLPPPREQNNFDNPTDEIWRGGSD